MVKKCIICGEGAIFQIKNTSDSYCKDCAEDQFGDLGLLVKVDEVALNLKKYIEEDSKL